MNPPISALEIVRLSPAFVRPLLDFHARLIAGGDGVWFDPHPFVDSYLLDLCRTDKGDLHYVLAVGPSVEGYGLLRGWDEGFAVPSLGIAIGPGYRGQGLGELLMRFLHSAARVRGASRVRLRVHGDNEAAVRLYSALGYRFEDEDQATDGHLRVAFKELTP